MVQRLVSTTSIPSCQFDIQAVFSVLLGKSEDCVMVSSSGKVVYVIGPAGGPFKIGIADDVQSRRSILNVGNPAHLRIWLAENLASEADAIEIEKALHYQYKDFHIRGEWFRLQEKNLQDIKQFINMASLFNNLVPAGWSLDRKSCDEFTPEVCIRARSALKLSQDELASKAGISTATLQGFESGNTAPQVETLESLRAAFEAEGVQFISEQSGTPFKILI